MSPGAVIAVGFWVLLSLWLAWEIWRAPEMDEDQRPVDPRRSFVADTPHDRKRGES